MVNVKPMENNIKVMKLGRKWLKACMDTDAIERQGIDPLISTLFRLGGWPMIMESDKWDEQEYSWQKVDDQYMRLTGKNAFYDVILNYRNSNIVEIKVPDFPPRS